jgi:hypothetical protein
MTEGRLIASFKGLQILQIESKPKLLRLSGKHSYANGNRQGGSTAAATESGPVHPTIV